MLDCLMGGEEMREDVVTDIDGINVNNNNANNVAEGLSDEGEEMTENVVTDIDGNIVNANNNNNANNVAGVPTRRNENQLHQLNTYGNVRVAQRFFITLANQLVPGRDGGFLLSDPNGFLYCYNKTHNDTKY